MSSPVIQLAELNGNNFVSGRAIRALKAAFPHFIQSPIDHTRGELDAAAEEVCALIAPALEKSAANDGSRGNVSLIGHSHMDTAWLWPLCRASLPTQPCASSPRRFNPPAPSKSA